MQQIARLAAAVYVRLRLWPLLVLVLALVDVRLAVGSQSPDTAYRDELVFNIPNADGKGTRERVCRPLTRAGRSRIGESAAERYRKLRDSYRNCTIIDGDLELTWMNEPDFEYDLSFLDSVREIWGALIIYKLQYPPKNPEFLTNLRIIRGKSTCAQCQNAALFVHSSDGLRALPFYNLVEITQRNVVIQYNPNLCFVESIYWPELLTLNETDQKIQISNNKLAGCAGCFGGCDLLGPRAGNQASRRYCWSDKSHMMACQKPTKGPDYATSNRRTMNKLDPNGQPQVLSCGSECAGGCTKPDSDDDCYACKETQTQTGKCVFKCQHGGRSGDSYYQRFFHICLPQCPPPYFASDVKDKDGKETWIECVSSCPDDSFPNAQRKCTIDLKEKKCQGAMMSNQSPGAPRPSASAIWAKEEPQPLPPQPQQQQQQHDRTYFRSSEVEALAGCTVMDNHLRLPSASFTTKANQSAVNPVELLKSLQSLRIVTGQVLVQGSAEGHRLVDLRFLRSIEIIHGASVDMPNTVEISNTLATELPFLHLKRVDYGRVVIKNNPELCYVHEVQWYDAELLQKQQVFEVQNNRNASLCRAEHKVCDARVCRFGCWGPGNSKCVQCAHFTYVWRVREPLEDGSLLAPFETRFCLPTCSRLGAAPEQLAYLDAIPQRPGKDGHSLYRPALYEVPVNRCSECHEECAEGCTGPNNHQCVGACRNKRIDNSTCVKVCPVGKYSDANNNCQLCHPTCSHSCSGPSDRVDQTGSEGGCEACKFYLVAHQEVSPYALTPVKCLPSPASTAKSRGFGPYFERLAGVPPAGEQQNVGNGGGAELAARDSSGSALDPLHEITGDSVQSAPGELDMALVSSTSAPPHLQLKLCPYGFAYNPHWTSHLAKWSGDACVRCKPECATCDENGECPVTTATTTTSTTHQCKYYVQDAKCLARDACPLGSNFVRTSNGLALSASDSLLRNESLECPLLLLPPPTFATFSSTVAPGATRDELLQQIEDENLQLLECAESLRQKHVDRLCIRCDAQCHPAHGCSGAGNHSCRVCAHKTYYPDEKDDSKFLCLDTCPVSSLAGEDTSKPGMMICRNGLTTPILVGSVGGLLLVLLMVILVVVGSVLICHFLRVRISANAAKVASVAQTLIEQDAIDSDPFLPNGELRKSALPNMAQLIFIKENELQRGPRIGAGAFGTVYQGIWIRENREAGSSSRSRQLKEPVAIKELAEGTSPEQQRELVEEARVLASVQNYFCVKFIGICVGTRVQLIMQLIPLGSLLEYVRRKRAQISAKHFASWSYQIAQGMEYLEQRGIVHRDLAARNVLVQMPTHVRISDFGLAKVLDNTSEYEASGGKMAIKWLAPECIERRIFTHKSDVWAYGVTQWEIYTYGEKPYEEVRAKDMQTFLAQGRRLDQPSICTVDVFSVVVLCWLHDAASRPTFRELVERFARFFKDPPKYFYVEGDKNARPKLENVEAPPTTETAIDEAGQEGIFESQMRSLDDMASDDNTTGGGGEHAAISNPALRSYVITGNPLSPGTGTLRFAPSTPTTSSSGAPPFQTSVAAATGAPNASNSRGENSVGTNYVHIIPTNSIENDATAAAEHAAAAAAAANQLPFLLQGPWGSPSATKYADRPLAPRQPNNGYSLAIQPLASVGDASLTNASANGATTSSNFGNTIPSRDRLRSESSERESLLENKNSAIDSRTAGRHHLRRTNSRLSNNTYLLTADRAHVGSRLASLSTTANEHRLPSTVSTTSVDLSLEDVPSSVGAASETSTGLRTLFATLRHPSHATRAGAAAPRGSRQEFEMSDLGPGGGQHLLHNGSGRAHPSVPRRSNSTSVPQPKPALYRQTSISPSGVEGSAINGSNEVPDIISSTLSSEATSRSPAGAMCTSAVDAEMASCAPAGPAGSPEYSTASLPRGHPRQHNMYASAHASTRHPSQHFANGLPNNSSQVDASQALYNRIYRIPPTAASGGTSVARASGADNPYYFYVGAEQNATSAPGGSNPPVAQTAALPSSPPAQTGGTNSRRLKRAQTPQISGLHADGEGTAGPPAPQLPLRTTSAMAGMGMGMGMGVRAPLASPQPLSPLTPGHTPALFSFGSNPSQLPLLLRQPPQPARSDYYNVIRPPSEQQQQQQQQQSEAPGSPSTPTTPVPQALSSFVSAASNRS